MGAVHNMVTDVCEQYFAQFRRRVYVTPKSYLSFLQFYKNLYALKIKGIEVEEKQIVDGLDKLAEAADGVNKLRKDLAVKEEALKKSTDEVNEKLVIINKENIKATQQAAEVAQIAEQCLIKKTEITEEERVANIEL